MVSIEKGINNIVESLKDHVSQHDDIDEKPRQNSVPFLHLGDRRVSNKDGHHSRAHNKPVLDAFHRDAFANRFSDDFGKLPGEDGTICYGNKIALKHARSGRYLHSEKSMVHPGATLKKNLLQYHVNSQNWTPHEEQDYWLVLPCLGQSQLLGKPVPYNKELRLQHCQNKGHLRPLKDEPRPKSSEGLEHEHHGKHAEEEPLEVITYPESLSDKHDVWKIQYFVFSENWESAKAHKIAERESDKFWRVDDVILLRHKVSKKVLRSDFEGKNEPKLHKAPVECTEAANMASVWRVVVPMILEDGEPLATPVTPVFKDSIGRSKSKNLFLK